ncbi:MULTISPECIES: PP2C family serine/threonine-protein phosphatase [unclassified Nonomuraea]|uniref:PP2C family serine/threonine-protein phosphatase n=1 Tax=unclassified Nonomuraea TaxID=2593643 RepID=UPI0033E53E4E
MSGEGPWDAGPAIWQVLAKKQRGASHVRAGSENQDAVASTPDIPTGSSVERGSSVAVSVADGHGSPTSFRSALGARLAVEVSQELCKELIAFAIKDANWSTAKRLLEEKAGRQLVRQWRKRVEESLTENPFKDWELDLLEERSGSAARARVVDDPYQAYGSTLLTAVATETFMAFWQIGDGDIVVVDAQGRAGKPLQADARLLGNATTSLCSADAARELRSHVAGTRPPLVLISTDGLANSYADDSGLLSFASDVMKIIASDGLEAVSDHLSEWLQTISERGSGDDIAVGILCRPAGIPAATLRIADDTEYDRIEEDA